MEKSSYDYWLAKDAYDEAERALARARAVLHDAERASKTEWERLVAAAEALPDEARKRVAAAFELPTETGSLTEDQLDYLRERADATRKRWADHAAALKRS